MKRLRRFGINAGLMVGTTVVMLVLAEAVARVAFPSWAPPRAERAQFWHHDDALGWAHRPGQTGRLVSPEFDVAISINEAGLRDRAYPAERVPGKKRLLVLGDSFAWGMGVPRDAVFDAVLEARHPALEVINAGVSGYGTDQQWLYLRERGLAFAPDAVLVLFYENDLSDNNYAERYYHPKPVFRLDGDRLTLHNRPVPPPRWRQRLATWVLGKTYVFYQLYRVAGMLDHRFFGGGVQRRVLAESQAADDAEAVTQAILLAMHRELGARGIPLLVASIPFGPDRTNPLPALLQPAGIPHLALDDAFAHPTAPTHFPRDGHWNAHGHRLAADALTPFLAEHGLLER